MTGRGTTRNLRSRPCGHEYHLPLYLQYGQREFIPAYNTISRSNSRYAAMHHGAPSTSERYRQLRAMTIVVFPLAFSLLLPCGLDANETLPAIGIAPMLVSAVLGALAFRGISPGTKSLLDLFVATLLISVLVPRYVTSLMSSS